MPSYVTDMLVRHALGPEVRPSERLAPALLSTAEHRVEERHHP